MKIPKMLLRNLEREKNRETGKGILLPAEEGVFFLVKLGENHGGYAGKVHFAGHICLTKIWRDKFQFADGDRSSDGMPDADHFFPEDPNHPGRHEIEDYEPFRASIEVIDGPGTETELVDLLPGDRIVERRLGHDMPAPYSAYLSKFTGLADSPNPQPLDKQIIFNRAA